MMSTMIYITYLEREGPYVKVWGQTDKNLPVMIEKALKQMTPQFEQGQCMMTPEFYQLGSLCCAKFKDGSYYRARVVNTAYINQGLVEVIFIDYGNRDVVPVNNLRSMARFSCNLISIMPQAQDFILAGIMHAGQMWEDHVFDIISNEIRYLDLEYQEIAQIGNYVLITLSHAMQDITNPLIARGFVIPVPIPMQQVMLQNMLIKTANVSRQEMMVYPKQTSPGLTSPGVNNRSPGFSQPTILTYKSLPFEFGSEHTVYVSYVTDGPCLFSVQLQNMEEKLKQLMTEINNLPLQQLDESPLPGCVCLARSTEDDYICRAVVTNMVDGNFKVFYVDFGNTEVRPFTKLYQIPFKYVIPKVMATRFALNGLNNSVVSLDMKCAFKSFVNNKVLFMRVKSPTPGTGLPLCDLWDESAVNAIDFVKCVALQSYPDPVSLARGINQEIKVSFVYGCKHFYVQLKNKEEDLNNLMQRLQESCSNSQPLERSSIQEGTPCNALYTGDGMYYRALIIGTEGDNQAKLRYIDYGNVETVELHNIKMPEVDLITILRPQAIECCLNGYQNMGADVERDNIFEELILEQDFNMRVVEIQGTKMLVDLIDKDHYNVASLLLEKIAAKRSQVSPALIQDDSTIEVRKRTPPYGNNTRRSPREENDRRYNGKGEREQSWREKPRKSFDNDEGRQEWRDKTNRNDHGQREERFNKKFDSNKNTRYDRNEDSNWGNNNFKSNEHNSDFKRKPRNDFHSNNDFNRNKKNDGSEKSWSEKSWSGSEKSTKFRSKPERTTTTDRKPPPRQNQRSDNYNGPSNRQASNWDDTKANVVEVVENIDYAADNAAFENLNLIGSAENVSISWFYNPTNFYCQLESSKDEFGTLMREIQTTYKKRKTYEPPVGCPVIALFPEDNALYRGIVLEMDISLYKVLYVDFGNVANAKSVYQIEQKHMQMPMQAYRCSIAQISPAGDKWSDPDAFSTYFEKDTFQCKFLETDDEKYIVELSHGDSDVRSLLINDGLAVELVPTGDDELVNFDSANLLSQTVRCQLASVNKLSDILLQFKPGVFLHCGLFSLEEAKQGGEVILQKLLGQNVIVHVNNVQDNRLEVTFYDNSGYKLDILNTEPQPSENISPLLPTPVLSPQLHGIVSHRTESTIFVQPSSSEAEVYKLLDDMFTYYENVEPDVTEATVGEVYAVWSEDTNCYRGIANSINEDGTINILYPDYGNGEDVKVEKLRKLVDDFYEPPALAVEVVHTVDESMVQEKITLNIRWCNDKWTGFTEDEEVIIEEPIVQLETEQPASLGFSVFLSHCDNPGQFYLQLSDAVDSIEELQEQLQVEAPNLPDIENVTTGILCAAPYSVDQMWYRAQVLDGDSDITTVRYVDYGNTDVLDNTVSKVKTLPPELLSLEHHAKRCSLYLKPAEQEWSTECCERFEALTLDKSLSVEILHQDEKTTFIELYADGMSVAKVLMDENLAAELQMEISSVCTGFVSHLNSPSEFWIQLESACSDLEWIADQLMNAESYLQLEDMAPGSLCAAVFPDDGSWYRARILSNTVAGLEVLFIDYGNSCTCSSLRELPEDLVMLPPLAQKCSLQKPPGLLQWSQAATDTFKEISADGITIFTVNKLSQGETSVVQLLHEEVDISTKLLPETFEGVITSLESFDDFTVKNVATEELMEHCKMDCLPGYIWNEGSQKDFLNIYNNGELTFNVEKVSDVSVRLYLDGSDIRSEISMTRSTPASSVHSSPKKSIEPTHKNLGEEAVVVLNEKLEELGLLPEEIFVIESEDDPINVSSTSEGKNKTSDSSMNEAESAGGKNESVILDNTDDTVIISNSEYENNAFITLESNDESVISEDLGKIYDEYKVDVWLTKSQSSTPEKKSDDALLTLESKDESNDESVISEDLGKIYDEYKVDVQSTKSQPSTPENKSDGPLFTSSPLEVKNDAESSDDSSISSAVTSSNASDSSPEKISSSASDSENKISSSASDSESKKNDSAPVSENKISSSASDSENKKNDGPSDSEKKKSGGGSDSENKKNDGAPVSEKKKSGGASYSESNKSGSASDSESKKSDSAPVSENKNSVVSDSSPEKSSSAASDPKVDTESSASALSAEKKGDVSIPKSSPIKEKSDASKENTESDASNPKSSPIKEKSDASKENNEGSTSDGNTTVTTDDELNTSMTGEHSGKEEEEEEKGKGNKSGDEKN